MAGIEPGHCTAISLIGERAYFHSTFITS